MNYIFFFVALLLHCKTDVYRLQGKQTTNVSVNI